MLLIIQGQKHHNICNPTGFENGSHFCFIMMVILALISVHAKCDSSSQNCAIVLKQKPHYSGEFIAFIG